MSANALAVGDFLHAFGASAADAALIAEEVVKHNFSYGRLEQEARDAAILSVLRKLEDAAAAGEHRHCIWEMAWADAARRYDEAGGDLVALEPSFISATPYLRLSGDYAAPVDPRFESNYYRVLRAWLFRKYLRDARDVYEFGCGSGFTLAGLARLMPDCRLVGLDWAQPAVDLINRVADRHRLKLSARRFDFFHPDASMTLAPDAVAMTFAALEQIGSRFRDFADWLIERRPSLVINLEPIAEFYDPDKLFDQLALRYHHKRQYLAGYQPYLAELAKLGRIELVLARRLGMGNLFHEGYSLLIWRPL